MNRIKNLFTQKKNNILSIYYTAGFPQLNDTATIAQCLFEAGADVIEIGIPFSDPVADGPTIQASNKVALDNGMTVRILLEQVKQLRKHVHIPVILMGYINPIMQYGIEKFVKDAAAAGVDGLILPDMPVHEFEEMYRSAFEAADLCNTFLISPTTSEERIRKIDAASNGFIYAVSSTSTTGAKGNFTKEQVQYFERLQDMKLHNPFLVGFGISNNVTFSQACKCSAGAIVGSAFVTLLSESKNFESDINTFVQGLKS